MRLGQSTPVLVHTCTRAHLYSCTPVAPELGHTFIFSPENKNPRTRHNLKFTVFGWAGHLDGSQWDHSFRVNVLKQRERRNCSEKSKIWSEHFISAHKQVFYTNTYTHRYTGEQEYSSYLLAAEVHEVFSIKLHKAFLENIVPEKSKHTRSVVLQETQGGGEIISWWGCLLLCLQIKLCWWHEYYVCSLFLYLNLTTTQETHHSGSNKHKLPTRRAEVMLRSLQFQRWPLIWKVWRCVVRCSH